MPTLEPVEQALLTLDADGRSLLEAVTADTIERAYLDPPFVVVVDHAVGERCLRLLNDRVRRSFPGGSVRLGAEKPDLAIQSLILVLPTPEADGSVRVQVAVQRSRIGDQWAFEYRMRRTDEGWERVGPGYTAMP